MRKPYTGWDDKWDILSASQQQWCQQHYETLAKIIVCGTNRYELIGNEQ